VTVYVPDRPATGPDEVVEVGDDADVDVELAEVGAVADDEVAPLVEPPLGAPVVVEVGGGCVRGGGVATVRAAPGQHEQRREQGDREQPGRSRHAPESTTGPEVSRPVTSSARRRFIVRAACAVSAASAG
jgi:hypothetical protein